jgi:N-acetylglucosaminyl-diphospho-decaprenol L-rhamnosyltransferase
VGPHRARAHAGDHLTVPAHGATAIYVVYRTPHLDLGWIPDEARVIVVHNDASLDPDSCRHPNVHHVVASSNEGFGAGVNLALPLVETTRAVLVNPDMELMRQHWDALAGGGPDEVVTLAVVDRDRHVTSMVNRYPSPAEVVLMGYRVGRWFPRHGHLRPLLARLLGRGGADHVRSLRQPAGQWPLADHWFSAAVCSIDSESLRSIGGFDTTYFLYFEDVDLACRLSTRFPHMTVRVPDLPPAVHAVGGSASGGSRAVVERHRLDSARRYSSRQSGPAWKAAGAALRLRAAL